MSGKFKKKVTTKKQNQVSILDVETSNEKLWNSQNPLNQNSSEPSNETENHLNDEIQSNFETKLTNIKKKIKIDSSGQQVTTKGENIIEEMIACSQNDGENTNNAIITSTLAMAYETHEKILPREFFTVDPVTLSKNLLGKILVRRVGDKVIKCRIVETEAYGGIEDRACHGYNGRFTDRTKTLFMGGGHLYVYLIYGLSHLINITASVEGEPTAALIRAVETVEGYDHVVANRNMKNLSKSGKELTNGPGKVSLAMKIDKSLNTYDVTTGGEIYVIEGDGTPFDIVVSKRINIDYSGEDVHRPWRFYIKDNKFISVKGVVLDVIPSSNKNPLVETEQQALSLPSTSDQSETLPLSNSNTMSCDSISMEFFEKFKFSK